MVWFQCEDCGENLKKPKLVNHFRGCSAQKLSCIDCGVIFNQQSVQGHTQCLSEAEKYGPKNVGIVKKEIIKTSSKENNCNGLDVSLGLSKRAPWSCSLCNVKATSQDTLLLHSQGKKHKSKVRSVSSEMSNGKNAVDLHVKEDKNKVSSNEWSEISLCKSKQENGLREYSFQGNDKNRQSGDAVQRDQPESNCKCTEGTMKEQTIEMKKKGKFSRDQPTPPSRNETRSKANDVKAGEACGKLVTEKISEPTEPLVVEDSSLDKHRDISLKRKRKKVMAVDDVEEVCMSLVKWKKLIKRALKTAPNGTLRVKELQRSILPSFMEMVEKSGLKVTKATFSRELEKQIQSSAKFIIDGRKVRLAP
ncbi:hypothetical protein GOP47_0015016 [Adiantum capillus-veneris]|uniref:U1-type domain-containing protein n=1 Tax=Adiantum capillus-veneris TaxID=13818 RepID=A0A9D4ZCP8_ADICA|nr:hypothetical protein GOP47_0015016 [Adiantum capillus-veneris]